MTMSPLIAPIVCFVALIGGGVAVVLSTDDPFAMMRFMPIGMVGLFATIGLLVLSLMMTPLASRVEAERAWAAGDGWQRCAVITMSPLAGSVPAT